MSVRTPRLTEAMLMERFEKNFFATSHNDHDPRRMLIPEFDGPMCRPDLVDVRIRCLPESIALETLAPLLKSPGKAKLLAALRHGSRRTKRYLARVTGYSERWLATQIRQLESARLIEVHQGSSVSLACRLPLNMVEITAYEGKLHDWRRAFYQALNYRMYCHTVWVVMPPAGARNATKIASAFQVNDIGLIAVHEDGRTSVEIKRGKRRWPANPWLYLMAVGAVLEKYGGEPDQTPT